MSSYIVVESNVLNADKLAQYGRLAAPTVAEYGGKFLARGAVQVLHGERLFANKAVIEFPSEKQALDWYRSEMYQALAELRDQAMDSRFQLVAGV